MYKENLFELIRQEEVIVWAGAGLSLYAGFPTGKKLGEILVSHLSEPEKALINETLPLPDLAEEFFRLKGNNRNALIRILKKVFLDVEPSSTECHDNLATIPHIKTVITTNYDSLIEDAFKPKAQVLLSSADIPYLEKNKTQVFKVHGDLSEPDSIIITESDYRNFFQSNSENNIYWNVIKERLSTKNVLFLGYNLEDPNVSVLFGRITDVLGKNRRESFLVAPNLPQHKVNDLLIKGIHYINSTAEQLILDLIQHLKEHIISDLENGKTSTDTFRNFLSNNNLLPELKADKKNFKVHSLNSINGEAEGSLNFSFKGDPNFIKEFNEFLSGNKLGSFEIPEENLVKADFWYGGLKFPNSDGLVKLLFKSTPKVNSVVTVRFKNGYEFTDIPVKIYASPSVIEFHVDLKNASLIINLWLRKDEGKTDFKLSYKHHDISSSVKDELELHSLLENLGKGEPFTIFAKTGEQFSHAFPPMESVFEEAQYFLEYLDKLKLIENNYNVRFSNFNLFSLTDSTLDAVELLVSVINGQRVEQNWSGELSMDLMDNSDQVINQLKKVNELNYSLFADHNVEEVVELHGQKINLGYKMIELLEAEIINLESILNRTEQVARIRSKKNKILISYSKTNLSEKISS